MLVPFAIPQSHVKKIAVNTVHGRLFERSKDLFNDKIAGKKVVGIENSDHIAASEDKSAIDGIVKTPVPLASNDSFDGCGRAVSHSFRFITLEALSSGVRRGAVQNEMLDAYPLRKPLTVHGSAGAQNRPLRVVTGGQNCQGKRQGKKKWEMLNRKRGGAVDSLPMAARRARSPGRMKWQRLKSEVRAKDAKDAKEKNLKC